MKSSYQTNKAQNVETIVSLAFNYDVSHVQRRLQWDTQLIVQLSGHLHM